MATGILIYEDNTSLRESLNTLLTLSPNYQVPGTFEDCSKVIQQLEAAHPDVILMDIDLPGINGIEAVKQIRRVNKEVPIIMLTVFDDNTHVYDIKHIYDKLHVQSQIEAVSKSITERLI